MTRTLDEIDEANSRLQRMAGNNFNRASRIRDIAQAYKRNIYNSREYRRAAEYGEDYARGIAYEIKTYRGKDNSRTAAQGNSNH